MKYPVVAIYKIHQINITYYGDSTHINEMVIGT